MTTFYLEKAMPTKNSKPAPKAKSKKASPIKPKFLDTLRIPGMSPAFAGYDGGIPRALPHTVGI